MTTTEAPRTTTNGTVAVRDDSPRGLIQQYSADFANVLPSHIKGATWVRVAQGALKKGKKVARTDGQGRPIKNANGMIEQVFELEQAAANNPAAFLSALLDAARQGLEPGTEQYYLTPRKVAGRLEILGITGYQGHIELIYRAGAVSSVVAEVVREKDTYRYRRGIDDAPVHEYPPFAGEATRGKLVGVYAYARMVNNGAISRVIELGQDHIDAIKGASQGSSSEYSPWVKWPESMWLKSAVRQLQKWVPTSAEYIVTQVRAQREGMTPEPIVVPALQMQTDMPDIDPNVNGDTGIFDAEVVPDDDVPPLVDPDGVPSDQPNGGPLLRDQINRAPAVEMIGKVQAATLGPALSGFGVRDKAQKLRAIGEIIVRPITEISELTKAEADSVFEIIEDFKSRPNPSEAFREIFLPAPTDAE